MGGHYGSDAHPMPARRWGAALVAAALVAAVAVGWWSKARCIADGDWTGGEQYHGFCYTDLAALWGARDLDRGAVPYLDVPLEYPVLLGGVMWATAAATRALPGAGSVAAYVNVNAALLAGLLLATVAVLRRIGIVLPATAWWAGLPLLALTGFINWDAVPVALVACAIWAHQRGRDTAAGVLVGLGAAAKLYPAFLLPLVVLARWRQGRPGAATSHAVAAVATWAVLDIPVALAAPYGWSRFFELNRRRDAHIDSLWYALGWLGGPDLQGPTLNVVAGAAFLLGATWLVAHGCRRRPAGTEWALLAPVVAWFLLSNKVYSPQYSLWLAALLLVTLHRAAPFVAFAATDVAVHLTEFAVLGGRSGFEPAPGEGWLVLTTVLRGAALVWVIAATLRSPAAVVAPAPVERAARSGPVTVSRREAPLQASSG